MADYGFKISTFTLLNIAGYPQPLPLNFPVIGPEGAYGLLEEGIRKAFASGGKVGRRGDYLELVSIERLKHALLVTVKGGGTGDEFEIIHTATGDQGGVVASDDALTWTSRIVIIFPPDHYDGMIVAETQGNRHHAFSLTNALDPILRQDSGYRLDVTHDVADAVGWKRILKEETASVQTIEFRRSPGSNDDTQFPEDSDITKIKIEYSVAKDSTLERKIVKLLTSDKPDKHHLLKQLVGGKRYADTDFDDEVATVVSNGRPRKYRIASRQTWFNYHIDSPQKLDDRPFILEITSAVLETYNQLKIALPGQWARRIE